jgi:predicted enzyme related to lactoylglutathione lyase
MVITMKIDNAIASVAVKDLKAASAWYEKLFRRPADSNPMPEVAEWKFERGGWLQVYELPERAGAGSCTLAVRDIADVIAHLQSLGIDTSEARSGAMVKTVMITDSDGNHLAFSETIDPTMAR